MQQLGLKKVYQQDLFAMDETEKFDTVISLMNGIGIAGDLAGLPLFLTKCTRLLTTNGQLILDSTDLNYLIAEEDVTYNTSGDYIGDLLIK